MKKIAIYLFALMAAHLQVFAEGTRETQPALPPGAGFTNAGQISVYDWGGEFATYDAPADRQLKVAIRNHVVEQVYLGFNMVNFSGGSGYIRIKDPNGNIVWGPHELKKFNPNPGWINGYAQAVAGPKKINPAGYNPFIFNPTMNGDYTIELNPNDPVIKASASLYRFDLFDVTVVDTVSMIEKRGRLWSKLWALTTNQQGVLFTGKIWVLREDSTRYMVDYNGMDAYGFGIISNDNGVTNTGDAIADRRSQAFNPPPPQGQVVYYPQHKLFLNPPDVDLYPFPNVVPAFNFPADTSNLITGCVNTGYCLNINPTSSGFATVTLDLDGVLGYQSGGQDRIITDLVQPGQNCIPWDGLDGLGNAATAGQINISIEYAASVINIPIWDAETYTRGILFYHVPAPGQLVQLPLFWDDSQVGLPSNLLGCLNTNGALCRSWGNFQGNERFMNTWSSAYISTTNLTNFFFRGCVPTATNDFLQINQGSSGVLSPLVNDNFQPGEMDPSTFSLIGNPFNGTAVYLPATQQVQYTPNPSFNGRDSVRYSICDTSAIPICANAWIVFDVLYQNFPPVVDSINGVGTVPPPGSNFPVITPQNTPIDICLSLSDINGDNLSLSLFTPPANGSISNLSNGDSCFTYTPNPNFVGNNQVTIRVCDNGTPPLCTNVNIPITVTPVNYPPNIIVVGGQPVVNDTVTVPIFEDQISTLCFTVIDQNVGQSGNVSFLQTASATSSVTLNAQGCMVYTPEPNYFGTDTITLVWCDNGAPTLCDTAHVILNIQPVNDKPVAVTDIVAVDPGQTICFKPTDNDTDVDNSVLNLSTILNPGAFGTYILNGDSLCYTPNPGVTIGRDTLYYLVCDNGSPSACDTGTIVVFIPASPMPPLANDDFYTLNEDSFIQFNPLANDLDPNGDPIFLVFPPATLPQHGVISQLGGQWVYVPTANYCGLDSARYQVVDGTGLGSFAWLHFTITCIADRPQVLNPQGIPTNTLTFNVWEDSVSTICLNFLDGDNDAVDAVGAIPLNINGAISGLGNQDSCFTYTPQPNFFGLETVYIVYCDDAIPSLCDTVLVNINVLPVNDPPVANPDTVTTSTETSVVINPLNNDFDIDGNIPLSTVTIIGAPLNGMATVNPLNGQVTYTSDPGFTGNDTIFYRICDDGTPLPSACSNSYIWITVEARAFNVAQAESFCQNDVANLRWNINNLNFPAGSNPLTIIWLDNSGDTVQVNSNLPLQGQLIWPGMVLDIQGNPIDWPGWIFTGGSWIQAADGFEELRPAANVRFVINPSVDVVVNYPPATPFCNAQPPLPPIAVNDTFSVSNGVVSSLPVLINDSHPSNVPFGLTAIVTIPFIGTANISASNINYTPASGSCGPDSLQYEICDGSQNCSTAWVYLNIFKKDTDNDGLDDLFESLTINSDNDSKRDFEDPDSDNDGIGDQVESRKFGTDCFYSTQDFDNDGVSDWRDLDSDNDGIMDYIERSQVITLPLNRDVNNNGIDDAYDPDFNGRLENNPVDTDGDGFPDYLDIDTDGDGILDWQEAWPTPQPNSGNDADGDGVDNAYEPALGGFLGSAPVDTDGDGIPDWRDIDSDNDGLLDGSEDSFDQDCNQNGIPDFRDPLPCNVIVPQGFSPSTNGTNDVFFIANLENFPNNYLQIFNRWGIKVYESETPYDNAWGGIINLGSAKGNRLPSGVYYYVLTLDRFDSNLPPLTGSVTIIND